MLLPLIVALGGSVAAGYGLATPSTQSYPALFAARVRGRLVNLAVPGAQCDGVGDVQVPKMPKGAAIVILDCGANDIGGFGDTPEGKPDGTRRTPPANDRELAAAQIAFALTIASIRRKAPDATIYVVNLRHWQRMTGEETPQFAKDVATWNIGLTKWDFQVVDIDDDPRMYQARYIQPDLLHPNVEGNAAIASDFPTAWMQNASPPH